MSDDKIVPIHGASLAEATGAPEPTVIVGLRFLLEKAQRGEMVAFAMTWVKPNGRVSQAWECPGENGHGLVAGLVYLQDELVRNTSRRKIP